MHCRNCPAISRMLTACSNHHRKKVRKIITTIMGEEEMPIG
jgi:hypothetical protein